MNEAWVDTQRVTMKLKITFLILLSAFLTLGLPIAKAQKPSSITAFVNVNVIPMDRERVLTNQTVIVRDGKIAELGEAAKIKIPPDALHIDGRGQYLIPGLMDMHTHL